MLDQPPPSPPALVQPAPPPVLPAELKAMLDLAMAEGDNATVERLFGYARRVRPDLGPAIDVMEQDYRQQLAARQEQAKAADRERLARANPFVNWAGQVEFGASATSGAVSSLGVLGSVELQRMGLGWTHKLSLRGEYQDTDKARAVERMIASWQPRRSLNDRAYAFGLAQYEHDPALGYDNRYSLALGAGVQMGDPEGFRLSVEGGPAIRRTELDSTGRTALAGRASADLSWPLSPRLTFEQKIAAFYEDRQANGVLASALDTKVSDKLKLRLSYEYRYENERSPQKSGSTTRASLVFAL